METLKTIGIFLTIIVFAITIIGAISTADAVFVTTGILSIFPLGIMVKKFVDNNSGSRK